MADVSTGNVLVQAEPGEDGSAGATFDGGDGYSGGGGGGFSMGGAFVGSIKGLRFLPVAVPVGPVEANSSFLLLLFFCK